MKLPHLPIVEILEDLKQHLALRNEVVLQAPPGAGKTTLINLITGVLQFNEGHITLLDKQVGKNKNEVNRLFGFVPQFHSFYQDLSPAENLEFFGAWAGLSKQKIKSRITQLLEVLG